MIWFVSCLLVLGSLLAATETGSQEAHAPTEFVDPDEGLYLKLTSKAFKKVNGIYSESGSASSVTKRNAAKTIWISIYNTSAVDIESSQAMLLNYLCNMHSMGFNHIIYLFSDKLTTFSDYTTLINEYKDLVMHELPGVHVTFLPFPFNGGIYRSNWMNKTIATTDNKDRIINGVTAGRNTVMKLISLLDALYLGYSVIYCDIHVQTIRNPLPRLLHPEIDIVVPRDINDCIFPAFLDPLDSKHKHTRHHKRHSKGLHFNVSSKTSALHRKLQTDEDEFFSITGHTSTIMFLRSNKKTIDFVQTWLSKLMMESSNELNDATILQDSFNTIDGINRWDLCNIDPYKSNHPSLNTSSSRTELKISGSGSNEINMDNTLLNVCSLNEFLVQNYIMDSRCSSKNQNYVSDSINILYNYGMMKYSLRDVSSKTTNGNLKKMHIHFPLLLYLDSLNYKTQIQMLKEKSIWSYNSGSSIGTSSPSMYNKKCSAINVWDSSYAITTASSLNSYQNITVNSENIESTEEGVAISRDWNNQIINAKASIASAMKNLKNNSLISLSYLKNKSNVNNHFRVINNRLKPWDDVQGNPPFTEIDDEIYLASIDW